MTLLIYEEYDDPWDMNSELQLSVIHVSNNANVSDYIDVFTYNAEIIEIAI